MVKQSSQSAVCDAKRPVINDESGEMMESYSIVNRS